MKIAAGVNPPPAGQPAAEAAESAAQPKAITMEDLQAVIAKVHSDIKADLGRDLKSLREAVGAAKDPAAPATGGDSATSETPTERTLRERITSLEGREALLQQGAIRSSLKTALVKAGADQELAELAVLQALESEGTQFKAVLNKVGGYDVAYGDGLGIGQWAQNFMASDLGKRITAPFNAPALGLPNGSGSRSAPGKRQVPKSQLASVDTKDLISGQVEIVEG